jgi:hypothetical protein
MEPPSPLAPPLQGALGKVLPSRFAGASQAMRNPRYTPEGEGETSTRLYLQRNANEQRNERPFVTKTRPFGERPCFERCAKCKKNAMSPLARVSVRLGRFRVFPSRIAQKTDQRSTRG